MRVWTHIQCIISMCRKRMTDVLSKLRPQSPHRDRIPPWYRDTPGVCAGRVRMIGGLLGSCP